MADPPKKDDPPKPKLGPGEFKSGFDKGGGPPRVQSGISVPKAAKAKPQYVPRGRGRYPPPKGKQKGPPPVMTTFQKQQLGSKFADGKKDQQLKTLIGSNQPLFAEDADEGTVSSGPKYDGITPAPEVTGTDLWRALQPPLVSKPGRRDRALYEQVLKQFAVANNPRYAPDAVEKNRSHIFAWDVSLAMSCEIPHFQGAKEQNLSQTTDWLRHEGPMRGWRRVAETNVYATADAGLLVVVVPKDQRLKGLAVVYPQSPQLKPLVISAGPVRGWGINLRDAIGVMLVEYFTHD